MKWSIIIFTTIAFNTFAQNSQTEFEFLIGKDRTDTTVTNFLTQYFSLFDEEYEEMWAVTSEKFDNWRFDKIADVDANTYEFPLIITVSSGKISGISVLGPSMMSETGREKWVEFHGSTFPGEFRFDMTSREMKKKYSTRRFKVYGKAPLKLYFSTGKLLGFDGTTSNKLHLTINGAGKRKRPVYSIGYY